MGTLRFLFKRFVAQRMLGLAVVVTLAFSIGVLVAGPIYADAAREAIFGSVLSTSAVTSANARLRVFGSTDFDHADADTAVTSAARALPLQTIVRAGVADVQLNGGNGPIGPLIFRDGAPEHLPYRGDAPGPGEIALPDITADALGVAAGDEVDVSGPNGSRPLRIVGTYGRADPDDPFWFGERSPFPDPSSPDPVPALVGRATFLDLAEPLGLTPTFTWDLYLNATRIGSAQASTIPPTLERIEQDLRELPAMSSVRVESGIADLLEVARQRGDDLRVPILLVVFQIGAVSLAVLAGIGTLALSRQSFELAVLHSRGFRARTLLMAQAAQALVAAVVALPLGYALGALLARLASRSNGPSLPSLLFPIRLGSGPLLLGIGVAATGTAILTLLSVPHVRRTVLEQRLAVSREDRWTLLHLPVEIVVLPLAILAYLQLRSGDAPDPRTGSIDPMMLLAPTLFVVAGSFSIIRLLLLAVRALDGVVGRRRGLPAYLAGRRLGRSPGIGAAVAVLLMLSVGLLFVSSSYRATVLRNQADVARQQVGSDWNVQVASPEQPMVTIARMPEGTTPISRLDPSFEEDEAGSPAAFGIDPATFEDGAFWRGDASDRSLDELLAAIESPHIGMQMPAGEVEVDLEVPAAAAGLHLQVTTASEDGQVTTRDGGSLPAGRSTARVPVGEPGRLLTITFVEVEPLPDLPFELTIGIHTLLVNGDEVDVASWQPVDWRGAVGSLTPEAGVVRYDLQLGSGEVVGGIGPPVPALPAILSPSMESQHGNAFTVTLGGRAMAVREVASATRFPTLLPDQAFLVVSLPALLERASSVPEAGVGIGQVWARGEDDPSERLDRIGFHVGESRAAAPIQAGLAQLPRSLAVGMHLAAAASGMALVMIGVAMGLFFAQRRRMYELAALRAMGVSVGQVRRAVILEQAVLLGVAIVAGLAVGYAMLRLTMPYVSKSLGFSYPEPVLVFDGGLEAAALISVVAASALSLTVALRSIAGMSVTGVLRGEAE